MANRFASILSSTAYRGEGAGGRMEGGRREGLQRGTTKRRLKRENMLTYAIRTFRAVSIQLAGGT